MDPFELGAARKARARFWHWVRNAVLMLLFLAVVSSFVMVWNQTLAASSVVAPQYELAHVGRHKRAYQ